MGTDHRSYSIKSYAKLTKLVGSAAVVLMLALIVSLMVWPTPNTVAGQPRKTVMISIDGFRPDFYLNPQFKSPFLRQLVQNGQYSTGVESVFPSVTYPNHTSLITGVPPAQHGIISNSIFGWETGPTPAWYWEAAKIKSPTILQLAQNAGLTTASVRWPVSLGGDATYLVPEIFGMQGYYEGDDFELTVKYTKPELMNEILANTTLKSYKTELEMDQWVSEASAFLLKKYRPDLTVIHLANVDHIMHGTGRSSPETILAVEQADQQVKAIVDAVDMNTTCVFIVGDHGFFDYTKRISPNVMFAQKGWLTIQKGVITDWKVVAHASGGQAGIYIKDKSLTQQVYQFLKQNENLGYTLIDGPTLAQMGSYPEAAMAISGKDGFTVSGGVAGAPVQEVGKVQGQHGYLPQDPKIHTGFIASGCGIQPGKNLGLMKLLDVAPTVAGTLGVKVAASSGKVWKVAP